MRWAAAAAAKSVGRYQTRDSLLILLFWHGLQVSKQLICAGPTLTGTPPLRQAAQNGRHSNQPIDGRELRLLRALKRESDGQLWIFMSERGTPLNDDTVENRQTRWRSRFGFPIHPHMLMPAATPCRQQRHGHHTIQDYLGHQNIQYTVRYTELRPRSL